MRQLRLCAFLLLFIFLGMNEKHHNYDFKRINLTFQFNIISRER